MRLNNQCLDPFKGPKHDGSLPQPGWLDRIKNYPDIDKKRLGPCPSRFPAKNSG